VRFSHLRNKQANRRKMTAFLIILLVLATPLYALLWHNQPAHKPKAELTILERILQWPVIKRNRSFKPRRKWRPFFGIQRGFRERFRRTRVRALNP
jgi:hypothetical protein